MAVYELTLPVDNETIEKLHVGDIIYLNGQVCTARDQAHLRLKALDEAGKPFPEDLKCAAIFHAGPVMKKDEAGHWYLSVIGPTTSIRMDTVRGLHRPYRREDPDRQRRHGGRHPEGDAEI